jgi:hypothetical protein
VLTRHSPSPWTAVRLRRDGWIVRDGRGNTVAEINGPHTPSCDRYAEDAHLLAAAPGLLAACQAFMVGLERLRQAEKLPSSPAAKREDAIGTAWAFLTNAYFDVEAALRKAKGERS